MLEVRMKKWANDFLAKGREEGKALSLLELLADGDISFDKAKQKLDILKSADPKADLWDDIYEKLNTFKPSSSKFNEASAEYKPSRDKRKF